MKKQFVTFILFSSAILLTLAGTPLAWGEEKSAQPAAQAPATAEDQAERVSTEAIKEKYWARGEASEVGVVQNRLYSKAHHFEASLLGGFDFCDPMLAVYTLGARVGYHFNEYFSLYLIAWKAFSSPSGTQTDLLNNKSADQVGTVLNTNPPDWFVSPEAQWSLLYGKLSVVGKAIIHYDLHFMVGMGAMKTDSGTDFSQHLGIGQQFFLSKTSFLNVDYRLVHYNETIVQKVIPTQLGQVIGTRANWSNVITLGVGFLFGGPSAK